MTLTRTKDKSLVKQAVRLGKHSTDQAAVAAALEQYIRYQQQVAVIDAFGTFEFDSTYDHKADRRRKRCP